MSKRAAASTYREFRPSAALDPWVACFWSQTVAREGEDFLQRILPDGCVDIIWLGSAPARVVGPATRPFVERLAAGSWIAGVRFRPGAAAAALNVAASELRNLEVELAAAVGSEAARQFDSVEDAPAPAARLEILERVLHTYLMRRPPPDPVAAALVTAIDARLAGPVRGLAGAAGISERQARRRFRHAVGYGLKSFQRIARLRRLRAWALSPGLGSRPLAQIAFDLGYADQAHLTREIGALTGMSPAAFIRVAPSIQTISDHLRVPRPSGRNLQDGGAIAR